MLVPFQGTHQAGKFAMVHLGVDSKAFGLNRWSRTTGGAIQPLTQ